MAKKEDPREVLAALKSKLEDIKFKANKARKAVNEKYDLERAAATREVTDTVALAYKLTRDGSDHYEAELKDKHQSIERRRAEELASVDAAQKFEESGVLDEIVSVEAVLQHQKRKAEARANGAA